MTARPVKHVFDCATGQERIVELSDAELDDYTSVRPRDRPDPPMFSATERLALLLEKLPPATPLTAKTLADLIRTDLGKGV